MKFGIIIKHDSKNIPYYCAINQGQLLNKNSPLTILSLILSFVQFN